MHKVNVDFRLQKLHFVYKDSFRTMKTAFLLQIFIFQFAKLHLIRQSSISDCNSAMKAALMRDYEQNTNKTRKNHERNTKETRKNIAQALKK